MEPIKLTLTLNITAEQQRECSKELNKLHGYEDGAVPLTDEVSKEHLNAAYSIFMGRKIKANVVAVTDDGDLVLEFTDDNDQTFYKTV